jgi:transglutaminase-like putative cysteine protease
MTAPADRSLDRDILATLALTSYSLAVAAGFARVFSGWQFMSDLALVAIVGHGVSFLMRRARVSGWLAVPAMALVLFWLVAALNYWSTMNNWLPNSATREQFDLDIGLVRDQFQTAVAPVEYGAGWATLAAIALITTVVMSDSFAFRAEARGEALVPGGVMFVFIAALASPRHRIALTVALIAAGVLTTITLRRLHERTRKVELRDEKSAWSFALPTAIASAAVIALLAGVIGPRVPGANAEPLYETRGRGGVTEVVSPLVDIRSRLTNRSNVELFRVNADAPAYWRATTLPEFDGRTFRLPERALERVDGQITPSAGQPRIRQQIQVLSLGGRLVPVAADPVEANGFSDGVEVDLRLNRDTSTLVTPEDIDAGDLFLVVSEARALTPEILRAATSTAAPDPVFTDLPDDLPSVVAEAAAAVTAGAPTSYDQAIALQSWFRAEFDYSLDVQSGHGSNAIESFLRDRVGYCEQFSATFAAMARTLGIPSRVAVGFTPGNLGDDGWYSVLGKNAHAWPELWFDGIGWVAFEPTPGRGAPGAESYTDIPAQQDDSGAQPVDGQGAVTLPPNPTTPDTVVRPDQSLPRDPTATTLPRSNPAIRPDGGFTDPDLTGGTRPAEPAGGWPWRATVIVGLLALMVALPELIRRIRLRASRAKGGPEVVHAAWTRAQRAAVMAGVPDRRSMTSREWALATADRIPVAARPMMSLADVVDQVSYAPPGELDLARRGSFGETVEHDCELWSNQISRIVNDVLTPTQRVRSYFTSWR